MQYAFLPLVDAKSCRFGEINFASIYSQYILTIFIIVKAIKVGRTITIEKPMLQPCKNVASSMSRFHEKTTI